MNVCWQMVHFCSACTFTLYIYTRTRSTHAYEHCQFFEKNKYALVLIVAKTKV